MSKILIYTDASFKNGFGGWSAIIVQNGKMDLIEGPSASYIKDSGSCEFYAIFKALLYVRDNYKNVHKITFNTDHYGIVDSFKRFYRGQPIFGKFITKAMRKYIFSIAKKNNYFLNINHIESHQKMKPAKNKKKIANLKKGNKTAFLIPKLTLKKESYYKNLDYKGLKKSGTNKSSILNNIVDHYSKNNRRKLERAFNKKSKLNLSVLNYE